MARLPRLDLPGVAPHVGQRGNNRLPCFLDDGDRSRYRQLVGESLLATGCQLRCVRYIDLNSVRARMTDDPAARAWSRCASLCGLREDPLLTLHPT